MCAQELQLRARSYHRSGISHFLTKEMSGSIKALASTQPEQLSPGQWRCLTTICQAFEEPNSARILLNGEVGSGKTLIFLLVTAVFARQNGKVAILAPTETLARQLFAQVRKRFPNINAGLFCGEKPYDCTAQVWIGTTALFGVAKKLNRHFDLVIVDEQHKFSTEQRMRLVSEQTHLIEASATPIPRSLAVALFDGCTIANLTGQTVKKEIRSYLLGASDRQFIHELHNKCLAANKKIIYLYSAVNDKSASANHAYQRMSERFPGQVCLAHGQMGSGEMAKSIEAFTSGKASILIASTAIEVGIDIPNVGAMVVNDPDRFGVAQLHQLRGRLARNGGYGHFVMYTADKKLGEEAQKRLASVRDIPDGFDLAEQDLSQRGFGEVAGEMQAGASETLFKLAKLTPAEFF